MATTKASRKDLRVAQKANMEKVWLGVAAVTGKKEDREVAASTAWTLIINEFDKRVTGDRAAQAVLMLRALLGMEGVHHDQAFSKVTSLAGKDKMMMLREVIEGGPIRERARIEARIDYLLTKSVKENSASQAAAAKARLDSGASLNGIYERVATARQWLAGSVWME